MDSILGVRVWTRNTAATALAVRVNLSHSGFVNLRQRLVQVGLVTVEVSVRLLGKRLYYRWLHVVYEPTLLANIRWRFHSCLAPRCLTLILNLDVA